MITLNKLFTIVWHKAAVTVADGEGGGVEYTWRLIEVRGAEAGERSFGVGGYGVTDV